MTSNPTDQTVKHPESPTTGREPDFDDDAQDASLLQDKPVPNITPKRVSFQEEEDEEFVARPPPRAVNKNAEAEATLIEAFPSTDPKVIKAVLMASGGQVEPAFNALLGMSDPDFVAEQPPPKPARPAQTQQKPRGQMSQMEQDELYARQLAEHYNAEQQQSTPYGYGSRGQGDPPMPRRRQQTGLKPNEMYDDREHSFFDDDLPVIKESIQKGFQDTQKTFNRWIDGIRKRIDGDDLDEEEEVQPQLPPRRQNFGPSQSEQLYGIRKSAERSRRSGERDRYDADPRVLGDDFTQLELHDNDDAGMRRPGRPLANPDLFKPLPTGPTPQSGPVDEVDALYRQPTPTNGSSANAARANPGAPINSNKKWQPLTSVAPAPEVEDHDPFSLGDSDEETEKTEKKTDLRSEDSERLKKAASEQPGPVGLKREESSLEATERSGSIGQKNKEAEEILKNA